MRAGADSGLLSYLTIGAAMGLSDRFGTALAAADFDRDGFADLAIGVPKRDQGALADVGQVVILAGAVTGLGATTLPVAMTGVAEASVAGGLTGSALTAADVDGDSSRPGLRLTGPAGGRPDAERTGARPLRPRGRADAAGRAPPGQLGRRSRGRAGARHRAHRR